MGVHVICQERVTTFGTKGKDFQILIYLKCSSMLLDDPHFITDKGTVINADMAFLSTGIVPNSSFLANGFLSPYLDPKYMLFKLRTAFACSDLSISAFKRVYSGQSSSTATISPEHICLR